MFHSFQAMIRSYKLPSVVKRVDINITVVKYIIYMKGVVVIIKRERERMT